MARKYRSGTAVACVIPSTSTSSPPRELCPPARLVNGVHPRLLILGSGLNLGFTSNIAVPGWFNVQYRVLPDQSYPLYSCEYLNSIAITKPASSTSALAPLLPTIHSFLSRRVLVPQRWFTYQQKALDERVLLSLVTSYSDKNYAIYGAKTAADAPAAFIQTFPGNFTKQLELSPPAGVQPSPI